MTDANGFEEASEVDLFMEHSGALCSALSTLVAAPKGAQEYVNGWTYAALVAACASHHPAMRVQLWESGMARRIVDLAGVATTEEVDTTLQRRSGWLYTSARVIVDSEEAASREPPRSIVKRIETSPAPSQEDCLRLRKRAEQLHPESPVVVTGGSDVNADDGLTEADRQLQQQQMAQDAENIDVDSLRHASSLPTLLKLFGIPELRDQAAQTMCRIALRTRAPDVRTGMQKRLQQASAKAIMVNGLWQRPKTMTDILDEANQVVRDAAAGAAERLNQVDEIFKNEHAQMGSAGEGPYRVTPVTKDELAALLQKHITWGFIGGSDRFRVRVRKVIAVTPKGNLQVLPAVLKRGPEHAIGEHHVSVAIWGKPGDVGEVPVESSEEQHESNSHNTNSKERRSFNRFNSGKQLVDDVRMYSRPIVLQNILLTLHPILWYSCLFAA